MFRRIAKAVGIFVLAAMVLAVVGLALEFVVFRYISPPSDVLSNVTVNQVVRYRPNTRATMRHPDGSQTLVAINAQGWSSWRPFYSKQRRGDTLRVAVIGDSYVHGGFVDARQGFPAVIERQLRAKGHGAEVYSFGVNGAPLSQYLNVLRREVVTYKPDIVVVALMHDDFAESYRFDAQSAASPFMTLRLDADGNVRETAASAVAGGLLDELETSATFRYLYYDTGLQHHVARWLGGAASDGGRDAFGDDQSNRLFAGYVFAEMKALAAQHGFKLVLAMDAVREAIYAEVAPQEFDAWRLHRIAADLTKALELPFVDLQEIFRRDYAFYRQRLEFAHDWHWNRRGNEIAGRAIARLIEDQIAAAPDGAKTAAINPVRSLAN